MMKAVIFDLDHTLFDRHGTLFSCVPLLRARFDVNPALSDEEVGKIWVYADDHFVYDGWEYIFACLKEKGVFRTVPEYDEYRSFVYDAFGRVAVKFDYTLPLLENLKAQGLKIGLITNGTHALQYKKLDMTGLRYVFDEIIVSGDVLTDKPDREIFLMMCEKLGLSPEQCVYVGDNRKNDVDGGNSAGMKTIWLTSANIHQDGKTQPDAVIGSLTELPEAIEKLKNPHSAC